MRAVRAAEQPLVTALAGGCLCGFFGLERVIVERFLVGMSIMGARSVSGAEGTEPLAVASGSYRTLLIAYCVELRVLLVYGRFIMVSKRTQTSLGRPFKPTKQELIEAEGKTVPDVIAPDLLVLFCGINPGLYTAAVGHHFARPGNRFWPALHR